MSKIDYTRHMSNNYNKQKERMQKEHLEPVASNEYKGH